MVNVDWAALFVSDVSPIETFVRGSAVYLALFLLMRCVLKRQSGTVGISDLLVVVLIADAAQNAMAGGYHSITDGILLVATILFWSFFLDWLGYKSKTLQKLLFPHPLLLVENGKMLRRNMRQELITVEELEAQIRKEGVEDLKDVKIAYMESDGTFSVIKKS